MPEKEISTKDATFYSHVLPSLETASMEEETVYPAKAGSRPATPRDWSIQLPVKACTTRCGREISPARCC